MDAVGIRGSSPQSSGSNFPYIGRYSSGMSDISYNFSDNKTLHETRSVL